MLLLTAQPDVAVALEQVDAVMAQTALFGILRAPDAVGVLRFIQKDLSCKPPRYLIYFKAQDTDALNAAFKEYSASVLDKTKRPSVLAKLHDLAQSVANLPDKVRHKQEERGL